MDITPKKILVALGGNALQTNNAASGEAQKAAARATAQQLVQLVKAGHKLVIVHGNGPQVGTIVLQQEALHTPQTPAMPLDTCGAMSQGEIGYWLQQALHDELFAAGIATSVAAIVTQTVVDEADPAFAKPTKPIGSFYSDQPAAEAAAREHNFAIMEDAGRGWRRVVPSPQPIDIVEKDIIASAVKTGHIIIAAGGGGVPVIRREGRLMGVEAVIDKDLAAEKLAELTDVDTLLILTAVDAVTINFRQPNETPLGQVTAAELQQYVAENQFAPGSMLPKIEAVVRFVQAKPTATAIITSPANAYAAVQEGTGTHVSA
jgi:carbamate kinase